MHLVIDSYIIPRRNDCLPSIGLTTGDYIILVYFAKCEISHIKLM